MNTNISRPYEIYRNKIIHEFKNKAISINETGKDIYLSYLKNSEMLKQKYITHDVLEIVSQKQDEINLYVLSKQ